MSNSVVPNYAQIPQKENTMFHRAHEIKPPKHDMRQQTKFDKKKFKRISIEAKTEMERKEFLKK